MSVRSSLGSNNNPTVIQFKASFRKLLIGATHTSCFGNCMLQDDTNVLILPPYISNTNVFNQHSEETDEPALIYMDSLDTKSEYRSNVLNYISGFIQRSKVKTEQCISCKLFLSNLKIVKTSALLEIKDKGGLTCPSPIIEKIVTIADSILNPKLSSGDILREKNLIDKVYLITLRVVNLNKLYFFSELDDHVDDVGLLGSHRNLLIRKIVCSFVTMRAKH